MIHILRCFILMIAIFSMTKTPFFAVLILILTSLLMMIYLIHEKPWTSNMINKQNIFNEGVLNGLGCLMLASRLNGQAV